MTDNWTEVHREEKAQPISIELTRGAKGGYQWSIKIYSEDVLACLEIVGLADREMRREYGGDNVDSK